MKRFRASIFQTLTIEGEVVSDSAEEARALLEGMARAGQIPPNAKGVRLDVQVDLVELGSVQSTETRP